MKKQKTKKPDLYWMMENKDGVLYGLALGSRKDVLENWKRYADFGLYSWVKKATPVCLKRVTKRRKRK